MTLKQVSYLVYLRLLSFPLVLGLFLGGWKSHRIKTNARLCGQAPTRIFLFRFYQSAALDILKFLHGSYGQIIQGRPRDKIKLERLVSGPALFLSAHFHNWELMGSWLIKDRGVSLLSVALPFKQPGSDLVLRSLRKRLGIPVLNRDIARSAVRHLQSGKSFGMLWDQYPGSGPQKITTTFFGLSLKVDPLPTFLASKSGAPVFMGLLLPHGRFRLIQISNCGALAPDRLARRYHRILEILIRAYPWYWYGLAHRRFKDQISYEKAGSVSRETTSHTPVLVSRETKTKS